MFRMSFDQNVLETVEEQLSVCFYAYVDSSLRMRIVFMRTQPIITHTWACSCVRMSILEFLRMWFPTCVRIPSACVCKHGPACTNIGQCAHVARQKPYFNSCFICFLSKCKSNTLFSSFCGLCPHFQVGEELTVWRHSTVGKTHVCIAYKTYATEN